MTREAIKRPTKGDRYIVRTAFVGPVLTSWRAPFTGGSESLLPVGLEFVIDSDTDALDHATAATARPDPYAEWERKLVSQADRDADKYDGYYLVVPFDILAANCAIIGRADDP